MSRLTHLRTFLLVYRAGSITGALSTLNLTQPAVSKHLQLLEAQLGQTLFTRLPRGLAPTGAAHALARSVGSHLDALEATIEASRAASGSLSGTVHLGGPVEFLSAKVIPVLADVLAKGDIKVRVMLGQTPDLAEALSAGGLDLLVATVQGDQRLIYQPLFTEAFVLVGSPTWLARLPAAVLHSQGAALLQGVPLLAYADDLPILRRYWRAVFGVALQDQAALVLPDLRALAAAARAGAGITVLPEYLIGEDLRRGDLSVLLRPSEVPSNSLCLAWRKDARLHPRVIYLRERLNLAFGAK
ncbi:LysR family transcriptional regulator [Deinococcus oregonensis]|uniref:LysR family transcriptional regulator n=1 Tax=Deinococcus oregonensis TaxID=1805970 RepID=A0ABV6AXC0_9DEIO